MTTTLDAWNGAWSDNWLLHWTYMSSSQPATSGGGGSRGAGRGGGGREEVFARRDGRRFPYLNIIDDAHLLPKYQAQQRPRQQPRRKPEPEPDFENDPDIVRIRNYLETVTGKRPRR